MKEDRELKEFRDLLPAPDRWQDGFGFKAMIGGLFVGQIMTPASMYMGLVTGASVGTAAQWVTVILFLEVARRSFTVLSRAEIYILYYMAGAALVQGSGLLWNQFLPQSESLIGFQVADKIPSWVAPQSPDVLGLRSFFHPAWYAPIGLMALGQLLQRLDNFGLGYVMFRVASDVEKLPFPLAPVGAQGVMALADASSGTESWRWRVFSFGGMLGIAFGAIYFGMPAVTGAMLGTPIQIFPLPFFDGTPNTQDFLPAVPMIISFDLGIVIAGMVLPFWAMVGSFAALVVCLAANPLLHHYGILKGWEPGIGAIRTIQINTLDFYFSFGLGLLGAIAIIGFCHVFRGLFSRKDGGANWKALFNPPVGRGDISIWLALGLYFVTMTATILIAYVLLDQAHRANPANASPVTWTLMAIFCFYGFVYTPIVSYVSARLEGIVGQTVQIPFVREATFILTGYQGVAIWFAPFPAHNYGSQALYFRKTELTGTSFRSLIKAEAFVLPIAIVSVVIFSHFIWRIAPVPSSAFPYAEKYWELNAFNSGLIISSTLPGNEHSPFAAAFRPEFVFWGAGIALALYATMSSLGLPVLLVYGVIRGLDQSLPYVIVPQFIGAMLGRFYFRKRFGDRWTQYIIVFYAGYQAGTGLITMLSLGVVFMSKAVIQSAY